MARVYVCWAVDVVLHGDGVPPEYVGRIDRGTVAVHLEDAENIANDMVSNGKYSGVLVLEVEEGKPVRPALYIGEVSAKCCRNMYEWHQWIGEQIEHAAASAIYGHARGLVEIPV